MTWPTDNLIPFPRRAPLGGGPRLLHLFLLSFSPSLIMSFFNRSNPNAPAQRRAAQAGGAAAHSGYERVADSGAGGGGYYNTATPPPSAPQRQQPAQPQYGGGYDAPSQQDRYGGYSSGQMAPQGAGGGGYGRDEKHEYRAAAPQQSSGYGGQQPGYGQQPQQGYGQPQPPAQRQPAYGAAPSGRVPVPSAGGQRCVFPLIVLC